MNCLLPLTAALMLVAGAGLQGAQEWYVSPSGQPRNPGTREQPMDLATALDGRRVGPGDTIWLLGGRYIGTFTSRLTGTESAPITVRQYPGERASIVGNLGNSLAGNPGTLNVSGAWTIYRDFEVTNINPGRAHKQDFRPMGVNVEAPHTKFINLVVHNTGMGFGFWKGAVDSELYGNIVFNNGTENTARDKRHGHAVYAENLTDTKVISDNVLFNQYGFGLHLYSATGGLKGYEIEGNVIFNSGILSDPQFRFNNILVMGYEPKYSAERIRIANNFTYENSDRRFRNDLFDANLNLGCPVPPRNRDLVVDHNYLVGGRPVLLMCNWTDASVTNNTLVGTYGLVGLSLSRDLKISSVAEAYRWNSNRYFTAGAAGEGMPFGIAVQGRAQNFPNFAEWQRATGLDQNSTFSEAKPKGVDVFVRPNRYESGRAHVIVYNWDQRPTVTVDVSSAVRRGMTYEIRNVQNYFGAPVARGVFDGSPVQLPMAPRKAARAYGSAASRRPSTSEEFNVFVILSSETLQSRVASPRQRALGALSRRETATATVQAQQTAEESSNTDIERYTGTFIAPNGKRLSIAESGGNLVAVAESEPGQPTYLLEPAGRERFRMLGAPQEIYIDFGKREQNQIFVGRGSEGITLRRTTR